MNTAGSSLLEIRKESLVGVRNENEIAEEGKREHPVVPENVLSFCMTICFRTVQQVSQS